MLPWKQLPRSCQSAESPELTTAFATTDVAIGRRHRRRGDGRFTALSVVEWHQTEETEVKLTRRQRTVTTILNPVSARRTTTSRTLHQRFTTVQLLSLLTLHHSISVRLTFTRQMLLKFITFIVQVSFISQIISTSKRTPKLRDAIRYRQWSCFVLSLCNNADMLAVLLERTMLLRTSSSALYTTASNILYCIWGMKSRE